MQAKATRSWRRKDDPLTSYRAGQRMAPKDTGMSSPTRKQFCRWDSVKDLELERPSWIIWVGPESNHRCPCKREAQRHLRQVEQEETTWPRKQRL